MIIHIAPDEKFINSAYWQFEQILPRQNVFYILVSNPESPSLKYVCLEENMILIKNDLTSIKDFVETIKKFNHFVFHGLDYINSVIFNRLPLQSSRYWLLFGKEFYNNPYIFKPTSLMGSQTRYLFNRKTSKSKLFKDVFRNLFYNLKNKTESPGLEIKKAMESAEYLGVLYKEEFDLIKSRIRNSKLQYFKFSYYPIEKILFKIDSTITGYNILLGNSANFSNNHLEIINILAGFDLSDRTVLCPLSYGDKYYAELINTEGRLRLKDSFEALTEFMPLQQYNERLEKCGFVIMNHFRQQAVGNVLVMLWLGAKVFLDERNSLYSYLKRLKVNVFSIKKDLNESELNSLLPQKQQELNRNILLEEIGIENLQKELRLFLQSSIKT